ncbi:MAG: primosomal protein N' [Phycisphaeraceae bacterium]|nr:MAG: primosomal protein N' [Phycisphaeraceae bacterium]
MRYARIAVERGVDLPDGLTYAVPDSMADLRIGERVEAPLGRGDAASPGFVIDVNVQPDLDPARIKPLSRRTGMSLPPTMIDLARWIARYYCAPLGMTLAAMAPAAVRRGVGGVVRTEVEPTGAEPIGKLPPATKAAWEALQSFDLGRFPLPPRELADHLELRTIGPINRLIEIGALRSLKVRRVRAAWAEHAAEADRGLVLTPDQQRIVDAIVAKIGSFSAHLVRGVTGAGKTEVYLRILERVIERGECAIVLVPEISLTPQTAGRFLGRLAKEGVAVLHSGLTSAQRNAQWSLVSDGRVRVVVGARSAIFAPFARELGRPVGLIIVDEEHDGAYKQDQLPRYNARDVAVKRAQLEGCPVVMGSASPSLESWRNAKEGRYTLHELTERAGGAFMPRVEVIDFAEERRARPWRENRVSLIGPRMEKAIGRALDADGQVILLLNRRGYANYICCPDHRCGWVMTCDDCDAATVYHRDKRLPAGGYVRCHHCLAQQRLPAVCPRCGKTVNTFGMGSQRVEEELAMRFPQLVPDETMLRLDSDNVTSGRLWSELLQRFGSGEVKLLVGTQMIAKGLDFPNVRLVGVVNADTAINLPDFRSAERTFQLISQVAGRAGRCAERRGYVIVQTFSPEAPPIRYAANHDYVGFADEELALRERAGLPPATRMARIVVRHKDLVKATGMARAVADALRRGAGSEVHIRGPMPCPISRISGQHRIAVELIARSAAPIQSAIARARSEGALRSDAHTAVDVDPIALL